MQGDWFEGEAGSSRGPGVPRLAQVGLSPLGVPMRMPGRSSGEPMNSIPAASRASFIASTLGRVLVGSPSSASMRLMVRELTPDNSAKESTLKRSADRAERICVPVIIDHISFWLYMCHMAIIVTKDLDWRFEFQRLEGAYAPSTMRGYYADVEAFENWCAENGILDPFPTAVETVCAFLVDQGKTKAPSTVRRRLYAIRKVHRLLGLPDPTYEEDVNLAMRRVRRSKPVRPKQAKGMTRDYLERFLDSEPDTPWGLRNRAMLSLGYELLTRRSELVALRNEDLELRDDATLRVLIRRSKADPFGEGRIAFTSQRTATLVREWQAWKGDKIDWLFCPIYQGKPIDRSLEIGRAHV